MSKVDPKQTTGTKCALTDAGLTSTLSRRMTNTLCAGQLKRSTSSYGANYLAACRTNTESDFLNKLSLMAADWGETLKLLDLLAGMNPDYAGRIERLRLEGNELFLAVSDAVDLLQ